MTSQRFSIHMQQKRTYPVDVPTPQHARGLDHVAQVSGIPWRCHLHKNKRGTIQKVIQSLKLFRIAHQKIRRFKTQRLRSTHVRLMERVARHAHTCARNRGDGHVTTEPLTFLYPCRGKSVKSWACVSRISSCIDGLTCSRLPMTATQHVGQP